MPLKPEIQMGCCDLRGSISSRHLRGFQRGKCRGQEELWGLLRLQLFLEVEGEGGETLKKGEWVSARSKG